MATSLKAARAKTQGKKKLRDLIEVDQDDAKSVSEWNRLKRQAEQEGLWTWKQTVSPKRKRSFGAYEGRTKLYVIEHRTIQTPENDNRVRHNVVCSWRYVLAKSRLMRVAKQ